jgi:hypothetical protein
MNVPWNEITVFVIVSNGYLFQLGEVFMLHPSFPVFAALTPSLET